MALNFDAQINLDVGPFLASIERAKGAIKSLNAEITAIANRKVTVQVQVANAKGAANPASGVTGAASNQSLMQQAKTNSNILASESKQRGSLEASREANIRGMARERYALYDVAAAYQQLSQIGFSAINAMTGAAIQYERAFTNVARTTEFNSVKIGEAARAMQYSLTQVAAEIPVAFGKVTEIATIGNQLGIAQGKITSFTKTVAQFSATTGMTVEATAMGFGRIAELLNTVQEVGPGKDAYAMLGSAIAYAGVKAVATEEQIASVTKEIATTAKMAKFTTPEVVGLATALASVGIAPEAARGSIMRTFAGINKAVSDGGAQLQTYASISGMSAEQFSSTWTKNGQVAFDGFVKGLQNMSNSGKNLDTVLRGIGLKNVRDIQTIQKLGDNYNVYAESIANANKAFTEGTFLSAAYGQIQDTVAAKIELLQNNFKNLMASLGEGMTGDFFKGILDSLNAFIKSLNEAARNPFVRDWVMPLTISLLAVVSAFAAINGIVALGTATLRAYAVAMLGVNGAVNATTGALNKGAVAAKFFSTALKTTGWLLVIGEAINALSMLSYSLSSVESKAEGLLGGFDGLQDALSADYMAALAKYGSEAGVSAAIAAGEIYGMTKTVETNSEATQNAAQMAQGFGIIAGSELPNNLGNTTTALQKQNIVLGQNYDLWLQQRMMQSGTFANMAKDKNTLDYLAKSGYNYADALEAAKKGKIDEYFKKITDAATKLGLKTPAILKADWWNGFDFPINQLKDAFKGATGEAYLLGYGLVDLGTVSGNTNYEISDLADSAEKLKKAVRTVVDYAADLVGIFKRIDDITFNDPVQKFSVAADTIKGGWRSIESSAKEAAKAVKDAEASISGIKADKAILEYQLSVAERYKDTKRAAVLRAQIAKKTQEQTDAEAKRTEAIDASSKSLTSNTAAGAANRANMLDMLGKYQSYIQALAATGVKGTELETKTKALAEDFIKQGESIGFNKDELKTYSDQFTQYAKAVHDTPRDVTVKFDATKSAEFNALQEYLAKEQKLFVKLVRSDDGTLNTVGGAGGSGGTSGSGSTGTGGTGTGFNAGLGGFTPTLTTPPAVTVLPPGLTTFKKVMDDYVRETLSYNKKGFWEQMRDATSHGLIINNASNYIGQKLQEYKSWINTNYPTANAARADMLSRIMPSAQFWDAYKIINPRTKGIDFTKYSLTQAIGAFSTGGFVSGPGGETSDSIPARLSNGEYVVRAAAVKRYGLDFMNSLNQMKVGGTFGSSTTASTGGSGSSVVYLSPEDRSLLRAAIDRPVNLYSDSTKIASTANEGNKLLAQRGLN